MSARAQAGQENFRLKVRTGINFTQNPPTAPAIQYRYKGIEPIVELTAAVTTGQEALGEIYHDFSTQSPVPAAGMYKVRAKLTISGKLVYSESAEWVIGDLQ